MTTASVAPSPSSKTNKWRYTAAFTAFAVLSGIAFYGTMSILVPQRLRDLGIENSTAVLGAINSAGSVASIFIALFVGALSDRTASKWGRRTPWIFTGAFVYGICFWSLSRPSSALIIGICYVLALTGLNMVQVPIYALISDRVEEESRATVSAAIGGGGVIGQGIGTLIGSLFITNMEVGFVCTGLCALLAGVLAVVIAPREPSSKNIHKDAGKPLWKVVVESLTPPLKDCGDFYRAFICRTCLIVAYQMIFSYQLYILQDHIGQSKTQAAAIQVISVLTMIASMVASLISGRLPTPSAAARPQSWSPASYSPWVWPCHGFSRPRWACTSSAVSLPSATACICPLTRR